MYIKKNFSFKGIMSFTGGHIIWMTAWVSAVAAIFEYGHWGWMHIPWIPISIIGTAVAFYIGFKNNQAYDRLWEARKIWGGIVNSSRAWCSAVKGFTGNLFTETEVSEERIRQVRMKLIYRHIAWLYALRSQLLIPTPWEHVNQNPMVARTARRRIKTFGVGLIDEDITKNELQKCLDPTEYEKLINAKNTATQIIDNQSQTLAQIREENIIDDFRHMELQKILYDFYIHQGKFERIKKVPLPHPY